VRKTIFFLAPLSLAVSNLAYGVTATGVSAGTSNLSLKVAAGAVVSGGVTATVAIAKDSWTGTLGGVLMGVGGVALGIVDPSGGIYYSGELTFHYDGSLMQPTKSGWLGDWGVDSSLPAPPTDPNLWDGPGGTGISVTLQQANPGLSTTAMVDPALGLQSVTFDWGPNGHQAGATDPLNIFATAFTFTHAAELKYLGDFAAPPPGAKFFVTTTGVTCRLPPPNNANVSACSEPTTSYFSVTGVPEPGMMPLLTLLLAVPGAVRKLRRRTARATK
jgi:hypothetical protein